MSNNQTHTKDIVDSTVAGYGVSYSITTILSALLVILKETNESVQGLLVAITGHHWITHSLLAVIVFVVLGAVLARRDMNMTANALSASVVGATVLSGLIIAGFFLF